jgi:lysophospholipid acyltransferase (LPLAT)-like uncharacterized protein
LRPLRNAAVQSVLAAILAAYLKLTLKTIRWRIEGLPAAEAVWAAGGAVVVCFWHARIPLSPACWPLDRAQEPRALISLSPDGAFIARAVAKLGFPAIRGSSQKASDPTKAKGGSTAFRETLRWLKSGGGLAITPDGPNGPPEVMKDGSKALARAAACPVLLVGLASAPAVRLNSWDRTLVPLPFGRGAIVWRAVGLDEDWDAELNAATRRAEALVA